MSAPVTGAMLSNRHSTPPLLLRDQLLECFPDYFEEIDNFSDIQCDSMLTLANLLNPNQSRIVLAICRDLADYGPNLFLDFTTHMNRYKDRFDQVFERIRVHRFSLPQSLLLEMFSDFDFEEYFNKIEGLSHETCLEGINNTAWFKVVLAYNERGHNFYLRIDNLEDLISLSVVQCQIAEKIASDSHYENQFDIYNQVKDLSDEDGQWALDVIAHLERESQWDKVINFMSENVLLHQALILVRYTDNEAEADRLRTQVCSLAIFQCIRLSEIITNGSSFDEAISQVTHPEENRKTVSQLMNV